MSVNKETCTEFDKEELPEHRGNLKDTNKPNHVFYYRDPNESTISKYAQAITTTKEGDLKPQPERLENSPNKKFHIKQLVKDTQIIERISRTQQLSCQEINLVKGNTKNFSSVQSVSPMKRKDRKYDIVEPTPTDDKARYRKIHVRENKAGFVEIMDETPENVRRVQIHPSGTLNSVLNNGDTHDKVCGNKFVYVDKNWEVLIFEDHIKIINGSEHVQIEKNQWITINGEQTTVIDYDKHELVKGESHEEVELNKETLIEGSSAKEIGLSESKKVGNNSSTSVGMDWKISVMGNSSITTQGTTNIMSVGPISISSATKISLTAPTISIGG